MPTHLLLFFFFWMTLKMEEKKREESERKKCVCKHGSVSQKFMSSVIWKLKPQFFMVFLMSFIFTLRTLKITVISNKFPINELTIYVIRKLSLTLSAKKVQTQSRPSEGVIKNDKFSSITMESSWWANEKHRIVRKPIKYGFSTLCSWPKSPQELFNRKRQPESIFHPPKWEITQCLFSRLFLYSSTQTFRSSLTLMLAI